MNLTALRRIALSQPSDDRRQKSPGTGERLVFVGNNEVSSVVGGPAATRLLVANQTSLRARLAVLYPALVDAETQGTGQASDREMPRRHVKAAGGK